jgi:hypothetical protein
MNVFFDANTSWRISDMLAAYTRGLHEVIHIKKHTDFTHNNTSTGGNTTPDEEFLEKLPHSGLDWKIKYGDPRIKKTPPHRAREPP